MELKKKEQDPQNIMVKNISLDDGRRAAAILAKTFRDDKGMRALFSNPDSRYKQKLFTWFKATLEMQLQNRQVVWGAYKGNSLIGLSMFSDAAYKPSGLSMMRWILFVTFSCGFGTLLKTILHDQSRKRHFIEKQQLNLEFIAVDPFYQGQGIGSLLMEKLQEYSAKLGRPIWLETTKPKNIKIFEKSGFALIYRKVEQEVVYFIMANQQTAINRLGGKTKLS